MWFTKSSPVFDWLECVCVVVVVCSVKNDGFWVFDIFFLESNDLMNIGLFFDTFKATPESHSIRRWSVRFFQSRLVIRIRSSNDTKLESPHITESILSILILRVMIHHLSINSFFKFSIIEIYLSHQLFISSNCSSQIQLYNPSIAHLI